MAMKHSGQIGTLTAPRQDVASGVFSVVPCSAVYPPALVTSSRLGSTFER